MELTNLIVSSLVLIFSVHICVAEKNCASCTCPSEKEDITTKYLKDHADVIERVKKNVLSGKKDCEMKPMDCAEVLRCGHVKSGMYTIWPRNKIINGSVEVYCDMDTVGGGWTVIQRRGDYGRPEDYFYKDWESYKSGFGDIKEDFWLGNDLIFAITNQNRYSIRFDLSNFAGDRVYAIYDNFWIQDEEDQYRLHISNYSGDAGDSMAHQDNRRFLTKDRDNDDYSGDCVELYHKGAWWFGKCAHSNLNGLYLKESTTDASVHWYHWKYSEESLSTTEIKIRPKYFHKL